MSAPLVLVVEPDPALRSGLVSVLRGAGHHTLEAAGAEAAQGVLGVVVPQAVLLDECTGPAGPALVAWLRTASSPASRAVPAVGLVGAGTEGEALRAAGATRLIQKPCRPRALVEALGVVLRRHARQRGRGES